MTIEKMAAELALEPLAYQLQVVNFLKEHEPELWQWASSAQAQEEYAKSVRMHLLRETYRLDADAHPALANSCTAVAERLGIDVPITVYQSGGSEMNAMLWYLPGEAHVVLTGPLLSNLQGAELEAILAHELAHYLLWQLEGGAIHVADRLLHAAAGDARSSPAYAQTARNFSLYTEIYADRGALVGCGQLNAAVAALVKVHSGIAEVSADAYLRQADEICAQSKDTKSGGIAHPETFIRARALRLWSQGDSNFAEWLSQSIEGKLAVDELDVLGQHRFAGITKSFLREFLQPRWFQTDAVLAHARQFFRDFAPATKKDESREWSAHAEDDATRDYWSYVLLDFVAIDSSLEELPLAHALDWSRCFGIEAQFEKLAIKELGLAKRYLSKVRKDGPALLAKAEADHV